MYKIANNMATIYVTELFQMRDGNNTFNLRSVSNKILRYQNKKSSQS